jgi:hypothetical protein
MEIRIMERNPDDLPVIRLAATGAVTLSAFFAICWIAVLLVLPAAPHAYLGLITDAANPTSGAALAQGLGWSAAFGFVAGGILALVHNLLGKAGRA